MSAADDIARLERRIATGKETDRRHRKTDAATHLRKAIDLLEGCIEADATVVRAAALLVEAADLLLGPEVEP